MGGGAGGDGRGPGAWSDGRADLAGPAGRARLCRRLPAGPGVGPTAQGGHTAAVPADGMRAGGRGPGRFRQGRGGDHVRGQADAPAPTGLGELASRTSDEFIRAATTLAGDIDRIRNLRMGMRERVRNAPLMNHVGFTRRLESAYVGMWARRVAAP